MSSCITCPAAWRQRPGLLVGLMLAVCLGAGGAEIRMQLRLEPGWNLVCLPLQPTPNGVDDVFAAARRGPVWTWTGQHYETARTLTPWNAYWVNAGGAVTLTVNGQTTTETSRTAAAGWRMTGPPAVTAGRANSFLLPAWGWAPQRHRFEAVDLPADDARRGLFLYLADMEQLVFRTFSLAGEVTGDDAVGAMIRVTGDSAVETSVDARHGYLLADMPAGTYRLEPTAPDRWFEPPVRDGIAVRDRDIGGLHFAAFDLVATTDALQSEPLGTARFSVDTFAVRPNVSVLPPDSGAHFEAAADALTLPGTGWVYQVGDILVGDSSLRFAKRVTAVATTEAATVLTLTDAPAVAWLAAGAAMGMTLRPDWRAAARATGPITFDAAGNLEVTDLAAVAFDTLPDGVVDWSSAVIYGISPDQPADRDRALLQAAFPPGRLTVDIVRAVIGVSPTWRLQMTADTDTISMSGRVDLVIAADITAACSLPGAGTGRFAIPLVRELRLPFTAPTEPPVYADVVLSVPLTVTLQADAGTTLRVSQTSTTTVAATFSYTPADGFHQTVVTDRTYGDSALAPEAGPKGRLQISLAPRIRLLLDDRTAVSLPIDIYVLGQRRQPAVVNAEEVFTGMAAHTAFQPDGEVLGAMSGAGGAVVNHQRRVDVTGPRGGGVPNTAPAAVVRSVTVGASAPGGCPLTLAGTDTDGDLLHVRIAGFPTTGNLEGLNPATGRVLYHPRPGFIGVDTFSYTVSDGVAESTPAVVTVNVVPGSPPHARFGFSLDGTTAFLDASAASDDESPGATLQTRWDFAGDGAWDTAWAATRTVLHTYPTTGTVTATCQVRDPDGLVAEAHRVLDLHATGASASPQAAMAVGVSGLTVATDASASTDADEAAADLQVRWDWQSDSSWDTDWQTLKTASHTYARGGFYRLGLQVRDSDGNIGEIDRVIDVEPGFAADAPYLVIDISAGPTAETYAVWTFSAAPPDLLSNALYRTERLVLRRVPAGSFTMGSPATELGRFAAWETPHTVTLSAAFYVGVFEVTQQQWNLVMGLAPAAFPGTARPVESVSWDDVRGGAWPGGQPHIDSFMGRLRARAGQPADLPTEAQWEYACRATTETALNTGVDLQSADADPGLDAAGRYWYNGGADFATDPVHGATTVGGGFQGNRWGLYDMHGNVAEWCLDAHVDDLGTAPVTDPVGGDDPALRTVRGGSWLQTADGCRSASRDNHWPDGTRNDVGFRVLIAAPAP